MLTHCCVDDVYLFPGLVELRMPLYFVLSGLFFKTYGGFGNFGVKKANKLLIPMAFFLLTGYFFEYLYHAYEKIQGVNSTVYYNIFDNLTLDYEWWCKPLWPNNPIWFLLCLFWDNLIFYGIMSVINTRKSQSFAVVILGLSGYILAYNEVKIPLYFVASLSSLPFFYLGYVLKNSGILYPNGNAKKELALGLGLVAIAMTASYFNKSYFEFYLNLVHGDVFSVYVVAASMVVGVLLICKQIKHIPYVSYLGRYSVIALGFHMSMIPYLTHLQHKIGTSSDVINFVLLLVIMPLFIWFSRKYLPYVTAQKDLIGSVSFSRRRSEA